MKELVCEQLGRTCPEHYVATGPTEECVIHLMCYHVGRVHSDLLTNLSADRAVELAEAMKKAVHDR